MELGKIGPDEGVRQRKTQGQAKEKQEPREKSPLLYRQKVFVESQSLLDELLEVQHFRTIYNIFVAILCIFVLRTVLVDSLDKGCFVLDFELIIFAFGQLHMALLAWLVMFLYTLLVPYKVLQIWASSLKTFQFPTFLTVAAAMVLLVCHATVLGFYPIYTVISQPLGPGSRFIIICEQIRFLMKSHSFLRETVPPILQARSNGGKMQPPQLSTYLYFLFCPTLIYRESYPRTPCVRWRYVIENFAKFLGCVFYGSYVLKCLCIPAFSNINKQPFTLRTLVLCIFSATLPAIYAILLVSFSFFHCWLNAFAEILCFADRTFYKDWWNSTSLSVFFRKWNVVVHDWLYYYIYQDLLWEFKARAWPAAVLSIFIISGAVHDYVFTLCLGFFCPITLTLMVLGMSGGIISTNLNYKKINPNWNILFWVLTLMGLGTQISSQCLEWYAHLHCPVQERTFWTIVIPRYWSCYS